MKNDVIMYVSCMNGNVKSNCRQYVQFTVYLNKYKSHDYNPYLMYINYVCYNYSLYSYFTPFDRYVK